MAKEKSEIKKINIGKIIIGVLIVCYGISKIYLSLSNEAIGFNLFALMIIGLGVYFILRGAEKLNTKAIRIFKYTGIACLAIVVVSMIVWAIGVAYTK